MFVSSNISEKLKLIDFSTNRHNKLALSMSSSVQHFQYFESMEIDHVAKFAKYCR